MEKKPKREIVSSTASTGGIECPSFVAHSVHEIHCEGIEDDSRIILRYQQACAKKRQLTIFCSNRYKYCEIYRMLGKYKYGEEDD